MSHACNRPVEHHFGIRSSLSNDTPAPEDISHERPGHHLYFHGTVEDAREAIKILQESVDIRSEAQPVGGS